MRLFNTRIFVIIKRGKEISLRCFLPTILRNWRK